MYAIVRATPPLPGARCAGQPELFDGRTEADRETAIRLCHGCPALWPCRDWTRTAASRDVPRGVVAGRWRRGFGTGPEQEEA